jgi:hyperosmotically inducible protein
MNKIPRLALAWVVSVTVLAALAACSRSPQDSASSRELLPKKQVASTRVDEAPRTQAPSPTTKAQPTDAINDSIITARVKAAILADPGMAGSDVSVNTDHGVVSLTGIIKSQEQAAIASAYAQRQDGVMRVDNQLAVNLH